MKACTHCKVQKPLDDFHRATKAADGRASWCKPCANSIYRENRQRTYDPVDKKRWQLKTRYGLNPYDLKQLIAKQEGLCALCPASIVEKHHIDHCHNTGAVRGLLCHRCNIRLGGWDDLPWRARALAYLGVKEST